MPTSSIFTNVKITDPKKAEAFINALDAAANAPVQKKREPIATLVTDPEKIKAMLQLRRELGAGLRSVKAEGWIDEADFRKHFKDKKD